MNKVSNLVYESTLQCAYLYIKVYAVWNKIEVDIDTTKAATSSHHYGPSTESVSAINIVLYSWHIIIC